MIPTGPGQLSTRQALLGGLTILATMAAIVAGLSLLIERGQHLESTQGTPGPEAPPGESCPQPAATPATVTSEDLLECPHVYDQEVVRYRGEAVRAVLRRGDRAWVQLNDDAYGLELGPLPTHRTGLGSNSGVAVSIPTDVADDITHVGDARHHGDILDVVGTFYRADPADGGGPTIQARTAAIDQVGKTVSRAVSRSRIMISAVVAFLALASSAAVRFGTTIARWK